MKSFKTYFLTCILLAFAAGCQDNNGPEPTESVPENGDPVEMTDFTVTLTTLEAGYVYLDIKPKDKEMTYYFNLVVSGDILEKTDADIIASDLDNFRYIAESNGFTLQGLLDAELKSGDEDWRYTGLMQSSEYAVYLYGLSTSGEALTSVNKFTFTTPPVRKVECDFEIIPSSVKATSFSVTIVPSDETVAYFYDIFPAEYYEEVCASSPDGIIDYLPSYITELAAQESVDVPYTVSQVCVFGTTVDDFTSEHGLTASTNYFVFAVGIGPDGTATTDPVVVQVTTAAPPANTFSLIQGNISHSSASYSISPAHSESYVALYERKSYLSDMSDEQIIADVLKAQGSLISNHMYSGNATVTECPLIPDEDYYILVFGYFSGEVTTSLTKMEFTTPAATFNQNQSFSFTRSEITTTSFEVSCNPYLTPHPFICNYMPYSKFVEYGGETDATSAVKRFNTETLEALYAEWELNEYADIKEFCHRRLSTDYVSYTIENLEPGTKYIVYAIGMAADGTYTTDAFTTEVTTTAVVAGPELDKILPNQLGTTVYMYFYVNQDSGAVKYGITGSKDSTMYDMTDEQIYTYFTSGEGNTYDVIPFFNIAVDDVSSGDVLYYAGILIGEGGAYTVIRHTYTAK